MPEGKNIVLFCAGLLLMGFFDIWSSGPSGNLSAMAFSAKAEAVSTAVTDAIRFDFSAPFLEKYQKEAEKTKLSLTISRCANPPVIDGKIMPAEWAKAAVIDTLKAAPQPTKVRLMYDDRAIYIAVENQVPARNGYAIGVAGGPAVQSLQSVPSQSPPRDDKDIWKKDHLELWFQPPGKDGKGCQFAVSDLGGIADLLVDGEDFSYNPDWSHAVGRNEYGWTVEMVIPKSALKITDWPMEIGFNIGRDGPHVKVCSWSGKWGDTSSQIRLEGIEASDQRSETRGSEGRAVSPKPPSETQGSMLSAKAERSYARAGDRWIETEVKIGRHGKDAVALPLSGSDSEGRASASGLSSIALATEGAAVQLTAEVYTLGNDNPAAQATITPPRASGKVLVDLRRLNLKEAKLVLKLTQGGKGIGAKEIMLSARDAEQPLKAGEKIKILLDVPAGITELKNWPVMFGVPFGAGTLWDINCLRLVDKNGKEIPCQKEVTGRWAPEGAVKWVRFDALVSPQDECFMEVKQSTMAITHPGQRPPLQGRGTKDDPLQVQAPPEATPRRGGAGVGSLKLTEKNGKIEIVTGVSRYVMGKGASPIQEIWMGNRKTAVSEKTRGLYVMDQTGRIGSASADEETMLIEARGPVAACVRFEGWYKTEKGENLARHITRVECFAGQPHAKVMHTLVLCNSTTNLWFKDIGWEFAVDAENNPTALFGISRQDWQKTYSVPLNASTPTHPHSDTSSALMLQDQHYMFAHGTNHFVVTKSDLSGKSEKLLEGEECGDWSALVGKKGGLMLACKETARQHPKEFEISADKINLHLFSCRAGEELDCRLPAMIKKWDVTNWYTKVHDSCYYRNMDISKVEEEVKKAYKSDAAGWAKTHELMVLPMTAAEASSQPCIAGQYARLNAHPVFALVSPDWTYKSKVMGPLHPKDTARFPEAEKYLDDVFHVWEQRMEDWGDFGFVDYGGGPRLEYCGKYARPYRLADCYTYTLRSDLWRIYARSGDRKIREFAEETNLRFGDNKLAHWDAIGKIKGLFVIVGGWADLPLYWFGGSAVEFSSTSDFDSFILLYQLTGCRRAREFVEQYAEGYKKQGGDGSRTIMTLRLCAQAYGLTWDPAMRECAVSLADRRIVDPQGLLGLNGKESGNGAYGPLDKIGTDIVGLVDAWLILGDQRYYQLALNIARYCWHGYLGHDPLFYTNHQGLMGQLLFDASDKKDMSYPEILARQMRCLRGAYYQDASSVTFVFEGIPYAEDLLVRAGLNKEPTVSLVEYSDFGNPSGIIFRKGKNEGGLVMHIKTSGTLPASNTEGMPGGIALRPLSASGSGALIKKAVQTNGLPEGCAEIHIPQDAPEGAYEILVPAGGRQMVVASSRVPMVVFAPDYWYATAGKWFFNVPVTSQNARIFFEYGTALYAPDGKSWPAQGGVTNWVTLPPDKPGLWAFEATRDMSVRSQNLPPFFAAHASKNWFEPPMAWHSEPPVPPVEKPATGTVYIAGAIKPPGNQALYLEAGKSFILGAAESAAVVKPDECSKLLPFREGTIEFWFKPYWGSFNAAFHSQPVLTMNMAEDEAKKWTFEYNKDNKSFRGELCKMVCGDSGFHPRAERTTIMQGGEWLHAAWVWGEIETVYVGTMKFKCLYTRIYINGKAGSQWMNSSAIAFRGGKLLYPPKNLTLGGRGYANEIAFDELRISDIQRYTNDFTAPVREKEFEMDEHTRALFHFNGNLNGQSFGVANPFQGQIK
jgi:hypothetical protein